MLRRSEPWHRGDRSGALRAGVFGVNDGLVSNTSVVMGFAGSGASASVILFARLARLLAGAVSMAAGEYVSMRSQREAYQREITLEAQDLRDDPEAEAEELSLIYRARGLDAEEAERVATTIMKDREAALDTMAREDLGLDPDDLGSPWSAALSSLSAFAAGAVVVVPPYMFSSGPAALIVAIVLASLALFALWAVIGVLNGRCGLRSGIRQLLIGGGRGTARLRDRSRRRYPYRRPARRWVTPRAHRQSCGSRTHQGVVTAAESPHAACAPESPMRKTCTVVATLATMTTTAMATAATVFTEPERLARTCSSASSIAATSRAIEK